MTTLNDIKKIIKENPNNDDLAEKIRSYAQVNKTCCDKPENIISFEDLDSYPYGWDVRGTKCKICGKIIKTDIT